MLFQANYGQMWGAQFKESGQMTFARRQWESALAPFNPDVVKQAYHRITQQDERPPSLPKFVMVCKGLTPRTREVLALPPRYDGEKARKHLAEMRKVLTGRN